MPEIKFYNRAPVPMEMHKVKIVQKLTMLSAEERLNKLKEGIYVFQRILLTGKYRNKAKRKYEKSHKL